MAADIFHSDFGAQENTNMSLSKFREMVKHRNAWHAAAHGVTKHQTQLSNWTNALVRKNFTISHLIINNYFYVSSVSRVSVLFNRQHFVLLVFILLLKVSQTWSVKILQASLTIFFDNNPSSFEYWFVKQAYA